MEKRHGAPLFFILCLGFSMAYLLTIYLRQAPAPLSFSLTLSWDEYWSMQYTHRLQELLADGHWKQVYFLNDGNGYGALFWWVFTLGSYPMADHFLADSGWFLFILRIINLVFHGLSFFYTYKIMRLLRVGRWGIYFSLAALAVMPGLLLTYKPFSSDYLSTFFAIYGVYRLLAAAMNNFSKGELLFSGFLIGASIGVKINNVSLLLVVASLAVTHFWINKSTYKKILISAALFFGGGVGGLAFSNPEGVCNPVGRWQQLMRNLKGMQDPSFNHTLHDYDTWRLLDAWYFRVEGGALHGINTIGIREEFIGRAMLALIVLLVFFSMGRIKTKLRDPKTLYATSLFFSSLGLLLFICITTNRIWTWYLLTPILLIFAAMSALIDDLVETVKTKAPASGLVFLGIVPVVLGIHLYLCCGNLSRKYDEANYERTAQDLQYQYDNCVVPFKKSHPALSDQEVLIPRYFPFSLRFQDEYIDSGYVLKPIQAKTKALFLLPNMATQKELLELSRLGFTKKIDCGHGIQILERTGAGII
jgi:hypothetical protein